MIKEKDLIVTAKGISSVFSPFYVPLVTFTSLFLFSYLNMLPLAYRLFVLATIYAFTILLPRFTIYLYRKVNGWSSRQLGHREKRIVPYAIAFTSYVTCLILMFQLNMPLYMCGIIEASLMTIIICSVVNIWWKISTHMAGIGGLTGALMAFSILFMFNPVWWLCLVLLAAGALGTSRIILRQHTLAQVSVGFAVGFVCSVVGILFL
ncbi:MAG: hypothetical protein IKR18_03415 [Bacteroidaceae bacterium]|nr:hypothetical protein [Bacteroidaceae bacterium]